MERIWACIKENTIVNTIVADEDFISLIESEFDDLVEITNFDPIPGVNWTVYENGYRPPQPYLSWIWDGEFWQPPTPMPETGLWIWDEDTLSWIE